MLTPYFYGENTCFVNDQLLWEECGLILLSLTPLQGLWDKGIEITSANWAGSRGWQFPLKRPVLYAS